MSNGRNDDQQSKYYDHYAKVLGADQSARQDRRRKSTGAIIAGCVVAALALGGLGYALTRGGDSPNVTGSPNSSGTTPTSSEGAGTSETSQPSTSRSVAPAGKVPQVQAPAGWILVNNDKVGPKDGMNYAVPADWESRKGMSLAWGSSQDPTTRLGGHATATKPAPCTADQRNVSAVTGIYGRSDDDRPAAVARSFAQRLGIAVSIDKAGKPVGTVPTATAHEVTIAGGKKAQEASIEVTYGQPSDCGAKNVKIYVIAASPTATDESDAASVWFMVVDAGDSATQKQLDEIRKTITIS